MHEFDRFRPVLQFFGVELAVFQITDSPYAPEFTVVTNTDA